MIDFARNVGWLLSLGLVMALVGHIVFVVLKLIWDQGAIGEEVDSGDALIASAKTVGSWLQLLKSSWLATVCAVAVLLLLWGYTEVGFYASLGFSALTYAISGVLTPTVLNRLKPLAASQSAQALPEKSSDSQT